MASHKSECDYIVIHIICIAINLISYLKFFLRLNNSSNAQVVKFACTVVLLRLLVVL